VVDDTGGRLKRIDNISSPVIYLLKVLSLEGGEGFVLRDIEETGVNLKGLESVVELKAVSKAGLLIIWAMRRCCRSSILPATRRFAFLHRALRL